MPGLTGLAGLTGLSGLVGSYTDKVLGYGPIAYWILNETAGGTAEDQVDSPAQDGAYTGVTLGQTVTDANGVSFVCPLFDGANDFVNIWTATFRDAFNGAEGTAMIWARVFNVGVWTDGSARFAFGMRVDAQNLIQIQRLVSNNDLRWRYEAGNVNEQRDKGGLNEVDWMNLCITWSAASDEVIAYYNGSQEGAAMTVLGAWVGNLDNTKTVIGAFSTVPGSVWNGWLAHCAVWDTALNATQIADLATV